MWSSESILLHTIINNLEIREMFEDKSILELGGGLTAFCGLGLAFSGFEFNFLNKMNSLIFFKYLIPIQSYILFYSIS